MQDDAPSKADTPEIVDFLLSTLEDFSTNRSSLEDKWTRNRDLFHATDISPWRPGSTADGAGNDPDHESSTYNEGDDWHSQTSIRFAKQKIMSAWALVIDVLIQGGKLPFTLKLSGTLGVINEQIPPEIAATIDTDIENMVQRLHQLFALCDSEREAMRCVLASAIYGRSWAKQYMTTTREKHYLPVTDEIGNQTGAWGTEYTERNTPAWEYISNWDVFWDIEAKDVRYGAGIIHRQYMSPSNLRRHTLDDEAFDQDEVQRAIRAMAHPNPNALGDSDDASLLSPKLQDVPYRKNTIRYLECWVRIPIEHLDAYKEWKGRGDDDEGPSGYSMDNAELSGEDVPCLACLAGDFLIRLEELDENDPWPFYSIPWEEDIDEPETYGVADNMESTHKVLQNAIRSFEDNKKLASSLTLGVKRRMIEGAWDGKMKPELVIDLSEEARDVSAALSAFVTPDIGQSMLGLIDLFLQFGDEESMVPKIQQGQSDGDQTAYEARVRVEKSGKYMGTVVRNVDSYLIKPLVGDFLDHLMADPDVPEGKQDWEVLPLGFTSFQDRVVRLQAIQLFLSIVLGDEELRSYVKLEEAVREITKSLDLDGDQWLKSKQMRDEEASQPTAQQILGELAIEQAKADIEKSQAETEKAKAETDAVGSKALVERATAVKALNTPTPAPKPEGTAGKA